jgi:hypothetical protein
MSYFNCNEISIKHVLTLSNKKEFIKKREKSLCKSFKQCKIGSIVKNPLIIAELEIILSEPYQNEIHFGFDYYMYLQTPTKIVKLVEQIALIGLHVT